LSVLKTLDLEYAFEKSTNSVLKNINLDFTAGAFTSIVGPSGSGKTTLLRLLAGHLTPSSGTVLFNDVEMEGPEIRLVPGYDEIRLVYQQYELRPNITARESIATALLGYTREYREERVNFLLDFFFLTEFAKHQPRQLSGGQQQRLAIAKAMANEPEVLLMDEPFSALDPTNSAIFLQEIKRLARETGTAVILVTHDTQDAMVADEVVLLMNGEIRQKGSPQALYNHPKDHDTANFFGPLNKLEDRFSDLIGGVSGVYIRPEHLKLSLSESDQKVRITDVIFRGAFNVLQLDLAGEGQLTAYDFDRKFKKGDSVAISLNLEQSIKF
jgi:ABC-type sugar transport system ATPase subunit